MVNFTDQIDWRDEFAALGPFLNGAGGVVRVRYAGRDCAPLAFVQTVSSVFERRTANGPRTSIRLDRVVYTTRYFADVRQEFLRKLGIPVRPPAHQGTRQVVVASGNAAGAGMHIEASVTVNGDGVQMAQERGEWVSQLRQQAETYFQSGRMMVIIMDGSAGDQDEFWRYLWRDGLAPLTDSGLLLLHMVDTSRSDIDHSREAPTADLEIDLPGTLDPVRQTHATEDLVAILRKELPGLTPESAKASARTLVHATRQSVQTLHDGFGGLLLQLEQDWGDD